MNVNSGSVVDSKHSSSSFVIKQDDNIRGSKTCHGEACIMVYG
jgi:hypothetical protein